MVEVQKVSMYDPALDAFRELDIETAKKFVASAKKVESQIAKIEDKASSEDK